MTVVQLKTDKDKDQASQVEKLEKYLKLAKEGRLESLAIVVTIDGNSQAAFVGNSMPLIFSVRVAEDDLCKRMREGKPV